MKWEKGFTLIELIVVIAIMGILVVMAVPSYTQYSKNQKLTDSASQLQTVLRQAQNNAQTGTVCNTGYRALGWRVGLNYLAYEMLATCVGTPPSTTPQIYNLPIGITISSITNEDGLSGLCDIPATVIYNNLSSSAEFEVSRCSSGTNGFLDITLTQDGTGQTKIIRIEKGGGIYVLQ